MESFIYWWKMKFFHFFGPCQDFIFNPPPMSPLQLPHHKLPFFCFIFKFSIDLIEKFSQILKYFKTKSSLR